MKPSLHKQRTTTDEPHWNSQQENYWIGGGSGDLNQFYSRETIALSPDEDPYIKMNTNRKKKQQANYAAIVEADHNASQYVKTESNVGNHIAGDHNARIITKMVSTAVILNTSSSYMPLKDAIHIKHITNT